MENTGNKKSIYTGLSIILLTLGLAAGAFFYQHTPEKNLPVTSANNNDPKIIASAHTEYNRYNKESIAREIINRVDKKHVRPHGVRPTLYFVGGTTGAGKSTLITAGSINTKGQITGKITIPDANQAVHIDSDEIKTYLKGWDRNKPGIFHQESRGITDYTLEQATEKNFDVVVQGTGKRTKHLIEARKAGYTIIGHFVWIPDQEAMHRIQSRYANGGNNIPPDFGKQKADEIRNWLYPEQISQDLYDEFYLWDNRKDNNFHPKLIAYYRKGVDHAIIDSDAFDNFFGDSSQHVRKHWISIE